MNDATAATAINDTDQGPWPAKNRSTSRENGTPRFANRRTAANDATSNSWMKLHATAPPAITRAVSRPDTTSERQPPSNNATNSGLLNPIHQPPLAGCRARRTYTAIGRSMTDASVENVSG